MERPDECVKSGVRGAVVDDDDLEKRIVYGEGRPDGPNDDPLLIVRGDQDGDRRGLRRGHEILERRVADPPDIPQDDDHGDQQQCRIDQVYETVVEKDEVVDPGDQGDRIGPHDATSGRTMSVSSFRTLSSGPLFRYSRRGVPYPRDSMIFRISLDFPYVSRPGEPRLSISRYTKSVFWISSQTLSFAYRSVAPRVSRKIPIASSLVRTTAVAAAFLTCQLASTSRFERRGTALPCRKIPSAFAACSRTNQTGSSRRGRTLSFSADGRPPPAAPMAFNDFARTSGSPWSRFRKAKGKASGAPRIPSTSRTEALETGSPYRSPYRTRSAAAAVPKFRRELSIDFLDTSDRE